jgi:molybdopterin-binding protein
VGPYLKVKLDCGFPMVASVTGESFTTLGLVKDRRVFASVKATAVHVIRRGDAGHPRARARGPGSPPSAGGDR